jgi:polyhydroxyalkanoate synthesis regulator phasin
MPENDLLRRSLDAGIAFTQLTRRRAEGIVKDLVRSGEVNREQAAARVEELLERSRQTAEFVTAVVRKEIDDRIGQLNLASRDDLAAFASRLGLPARPKKAQAKKAAAKAKKVAPKKAAAKKAPAAKKAAVKAAAKKAPVKKAAPPASA